MRRQILIIASIALAILLGAIMQGVWAQESLIDNSISLSPQLESRQWLFIFNKGDKLTGVLSCTVGTLDIIISLDELTAMYRQRALEGASVPFSWVIPAAGSWNVKVLIAQNSTCAGHIKLGVERATAAGVLGLALGPLEWIVILAIVALIVVAIVSAVRLRTTRGMDKAKSQKAQRAPSTFHHCHWKGPRKNIMWANGLLRNRLNLAARAFHFSNLTR